MALYDALVRLGPFNQEPMQFSWDNEFQGCVLGMESEIDDAFEIDDDDINDEDDVLTSVQEIRMREVRSTCLRCREGFCLSHGTKLGAYKERAPWAAMTQLPLEEEAAGAQEEEIEEVTDPDRSQIQGVPRICKNEGCGKTFLEEENHSTACLYHRGPIAFGNRSTDDHKWVCCGVPVSSYSELASVQPCTRGKHYAPPHRN